MLLWVRCAPIRTHHEREEHRHDRDRTHRQHPTASGIDRRHGRVRRGRACPLEGLRALQDDALRDTIERFEATGSPVISDGEQTKSSFVTYPFEGLENLSPEGAVIPFADGHTRQLPVLTSGPFRFESAGTPTST